MEEIIQKLAERLGYLYTRWQDEKDYEDFSDYIEGMKNYAETLKVEFVVMENSPWFAAVFKYMDEEPFCLRASMKGVECLQN